MSTPAKSKEKRTLLKINKALLANTEGLTKTQISQITGLKIDTVSKHLQKDLADGFVKEPLSKKFQLTNKGIVNHNKLIDEKILDESDFRYPMANVFSTETLWGSAITTLVAHCESPLKEELEKEFESFKENFKSFSSRIPKDIGEIHIALHYEPKKVKKNAGSP